MPKIIIPLCEKLFSWAFHMIIICFNRSDSLSRSFIGRMPLIIIPLCEKLSNGYFIFLKLMIGFHAVFNTFPDFLNYLKAAILLIKLSILPICLQTIESTLSRFKFLSNMLHSCIRHHTKLWRLLLF